MSWRESTLVSERREFVRLAGAEGANLSELCRRYGVARPTAYKWTQRHASGEPLSDRSRRPLTSPRQTDAATEALVCRLRGQHPAWGGRKLHHYLRRDGVMPLPAPSTINSILRRNGLLSQERRQLRDWQRFEAQAPNHLWQMDFKGPLATESGPCQALTVLDDHSRFSICLAICPDQTRQTVQDRLIQAFRRYGKPDCILSDNGPPWGSHQDGLTRVTGLGVWLMRHHIFVSHGRPAHPQTQGKDERFHLTLSRELLSTRPQWRHPEELARAAADWRELYNWRRPHEALGHEPPGSRYRPSLRAYTEVPPDTLYPSGDELRRVQTGGLISFQGHTYRVGRAFTGETVALRAVSDARWDVYYCLQRIAMVDISHHLQV